MSKKNYIKVIRPVLTYACATWATTKGDEENLKKNTYMIQYLIPKPNNGN